jgi:hypothetical protein
MMVLVLLLLSANTAPTAADTTTTANDRRKNRRLRSRRVADALDELNLGYADLYLPGSSNTTATNGVVSCHRTFSEGGVGWHGQCDDGYDANFVQQQQQPRPDGVVPRLQTFGTYRTGSKICRVGPDATGLPTVECTDENEFEMEEEADLEEALDDDETQDRKLAELNVTFAMSHVSLDQGRRRLYDDSGSTIDVLVVWTTLAECLNSKLEIDKCTLTAQTESNMRGLIDLAMVETNVAFALSNIKTQLRLVHAYRDGSYQEPAPTTSAPNVWTTMLEHLTQVTDGQLDGVHAVRTRYGADVVHMIAGSAGSCGAAHVGPRKNRVFSLSRHSCATGYYSFGHEIAHSVRVIYPFVCCCFFAFSFSNVSPLVLVPLLISDVVVVARPPRHSWEPITTGRLWRSAARKMRPITLVTAIRRLNFAPSSRTGVRWTSATICQRTVVSVSNDFLMP